MKDEINRNNWPINIIIIVGVQDDIDGASVNDSTPGHWTVTPEVDNLQCWLKQRMGEHLQSILETGWLLKETTYTAV